MATRPEQGNLDVVLEKLKRHAEHAHKSEEDLQALAHDVTDFDKVFARFSHLLEPVVDKAIDEALIDYRAVFTHSLEEDMARRRAKHDLARVFHLPIKLFLSRLQQNIPLYSIAGKISNFFLEYGALHAGLVVGNIRIEWGQESIVEAQYEDEVPRDDFVGTLDPKKGHLAKVSVEIHQKFSLAHRERRVDDKIKLIIDTAEKKREVLSRLVRVITSYNLKKKYDLFTCNCQHFVRDALAALGIEEPPRFSGQLKHHLERLKQGKVEVPEDFKNHGTLDAYVREQLKAEPRALNQHDMEYLLLHYYRIHLNSMPEEETDDWKCSVPTCKYEYLADRVNRESLLNHQFLSSPAAPNSLESSKSPVHPPTPSLTAITDIAEESIAITPEDQRTEDEQRREEKQRRREEERRRQEELRRQQIEEDEQTARRIAADDAQEGLYNRHVDRGYHARVVNKLHRLPKYAEENLDKLATVLTELEPFRKEYDCFPAAVEETTKAYAMDAAADSVWVEEQYLPLDTAKSKVEERYEKVCKFPVKVFLRVKPTAQAPPTGGVGGVFGAQLDAALLIWDHLFEWNDSSLVIPQPVDLKRLPPALITSVLCGSKWATYVANQRSKLRKVVRSPTGRMHKEEIELLFKLTKEKDGLVDAVIKTVIDYNRNKQYHERDCNNRHFIRDVTTAMGIKKLPEVRESLGTQLEQSRRLCMETLPRTDFVDHADLDAFVGYYCENDSLSSLNIQDIEYLICKYFQFHVRHWELSQNPQQWTCQQQNCQLRHLEEWLEKFSLAGDKPCVIL